MNEQALMQIFDDLLTVTEKLLEDHIRLAREMPNFSVNPELLQLTSTIRLQRQRVHTIVNP
jgi:hypothetical protein